jgi:lysophospholipase L1-like esterase
VASEDSEHMRIALLIPLLVALVPADPTAQGPRTPAAVGSAHGAEVSAGRPLKIMPLGDSITYGEPDPSYGGYRHALWPLLKRDGYTVDFVGSERSGEDAIPDPNNEGHPGWTIPQIKQGLETNSWLERADPDIILLHIGTNDIRVGYAAAAPPYFAALLDDILKRRPHAHLVVAQIIPYRAGPDHDNRSFNDAVSRIVGSKGAHVSLVDMRTTLSSSDYADDLHPNASGYDKMARVWEAGIRAVLSKTSARRDGVSRVNGSSAERASNSP